MKRYRLVAVALVLLAGCLGEGEGPGETADGAVDFGGRADMAGFMGDCYRGSGFATDQDCETSSRDAEARTHNWSRLTISADAAARYLNEDGSEANTHVDLVLEDHDNYFQPEAEVPVVFRAVVCSLHRECAYSARSNTLIFHRDEGTRTLRAAADIHTSNSWGAESVDLVDKLEILVPGVGTLIVLDL